jgi:hypothetical protein
MNNLKRFTSCKSHQGWLLDAANVRRASSMRSLSVALLGLALLLGMAEPASAAPVTTITHEKGLVDTFVGVINGCDEAGPLYRVTTTSNQVEKETLKEDGTFHGTNNFTGKVVAVPLDRSLPTYTGRWTGGGAFNGNTSTFTSVYTFSLTLKGSDGSKYSENEMIHFNERPDGTENFFGRCNNRA